MNINKDRAKIISVFMSKEKFEIFKNNAKKAGIPQSAYLRELALNTDYVKHRKTFEDLLNTNKLLLENLHRIGSNINQIAYALNINVSQSDESIAFEMRELKKLLQEYKDFMSTSKFPKLLKKRKFGNE